MYKIGLSSGGFKLTEDNFLKLQKSGIEAIEISMDESEYCNINYAEVKDLSARYGIKLWSYHLPFAPFETIDPSSLNSDVRKNTTEYFEELIKKGSDIGIDKFIVHPSAEIFSTDKREERLLYSAETLNNLADRASKYGAVIAVEDLPRDCIGNCSDEILKLISANDKLKVCYDTNHLLNEDNIDFIKKVGEKIITLHISDYDFINERHWLPGEGKIDWSALINALNEVKYNGPWLYEISLEFPKTIYRDRELEFGDFKENAKCLFSGKNPPIFSHPKPNLGMWE